MGLTPTPTGVTPTPSRPRLTPRRTRRGRRRVRGGRGATSRRGEKPKPSRAGGCVFASPEKLFSNFFSAPRATAILYHGWYRREETTTSRVRPIFERSRVACGVEARPRLRRPTRARTSGAPRIFCLTMDSRYVPRPPARRRSLGARPRESCLDRSFRFSTHRLSHDGCPPPRRIAALDCARIARSRARSDLAGPTRGPERLSTSRALAARARAIPSSTLTVPLSHFLQGDTTEQAGRAPS